MLERDIRKTKVFIELLKFLHEEEIIRGNLLVSRKLYTTVQISFTSLFNQEEGKITPKGEIRMGLPFVRLT